MDHRLMLEVPEEIYEPLLKEAEQTGQQPESLAVRRLIQATRGSVDAPLEQFIGAFPDGGSDRADRRDWYLGQAALGLEWSPGDEG